MNHDDMFLPWSVLWTREEIARKEKLTRPQQPDRRQGVSEEAGRRELIPASISLSGDDAA
jgi:hypothetical protein